MTEAGRLWYTIEIQKRPVRRAGRALLEDGREERDGAEKEPKRRMAGILVD